MQEYFQFDPLQDNLKPQLQGYFLEGSQYQPIEPEFSEEGYLQLKSLVLNLYLRNEGDDLRFYELETGTKLLTLEEAAEELARLRAEYEKLRKQLGA